MMSTMRRRMVFRAVSVVIGVGLFNGLEYVFGGWSLAIAVLFTGTLLIVVGAAAFADYETQKKQRRQRQCRCQPDPDCPIHRTTS
jgi:hypothetical protein